MAYEELLQKWDEFLSRPDAQAFITHLASGLARPRTGSVGQHFAQAMLAGLGGLQQQRANEANRLLDALRLEAALLGDQAQMDLKRQEMGLRRELADKEAALRMWEIQNAPPAQPRTDPEKIAADLFKTVYESSLLFGEPYEDEDLPLLYRAIRSMVGGGPLYPPPPRKSEKEKLRKQESRVVTERPSVPLVKNEDLPAQERRVAQLHVARVWAALVDPNVRPEQRRAALEQVPEKYRVLVFDRVREAFGDDAEFARRMGIGGR